MRFQFDDFIVDDDTRQVQRDGTPVRLSPKAFDLLQTLIRERPRAITKTELHERLWPRTFVSDASLAMVVTELRAALGESARRPRCIRTVHRHGYAFQASARETPQLRRSTDIQPPPGDASTMAFWLMSESQQISLAAGDNIVGRDPKARVFLDSPSVSRRHARIRVEHDCVTVEDLGSKNGTRIRDAQVMDVTLLANGDELRFGSVGVTFRVWTAAPTRTEADPK